MKETIAKTWDFYHKAALFYLLGNLLAFIPTTLENLLGVSIPGSGLCSIAALVFEILFLRQLYNIANYTTTEKLHTAIIINVIGYVLVFVSSLVLVGVTMSVVAGNASASSLRIATLFVAFCGLIVSFASIVEIQGHMELVGNYSEKVTKTLKAALILTIITIIFSLLVSIPSVYTVFDDSFFENMENVNGNPLALLGTWGILLEIVSSILSLATYIVHYGALKGIEELALEFDAERIREI